MRVEDAMNEAPVSCGLRTNLASAAELMWKNGCGSLVVVDETGSPAGILTDRDMAIALGTRNRRASDLTAGEIMTSPIATCRRGDGIEWALAKMKERKVRRLPVLDQTRALVGILTLDDVILHAAQVRGNVSAVSYDEVMSTLKAVVGHK